MREKGPAGLVAEYDGLRGKADGLPTAAFTTNRDRNRYVDIGCLDATRVKLKEPSTGESEESYDYVHANYVRGPVFGDREYICTQGPLASTLDDFWKMVWEQDVVVLVMLCLHRENGKAKCDEYYKQAEGEELDVESGYKIKTAKVDKVTEGKHELVLTTLEVFKPGVDKPRILLHCLHSNWPDRTLPPGSQSLIPIMARFRAHHVRLAQANGIAPAASPKLVHCSAGVGRSGTFVAIDAAVALLEPPPEAPPASIASTELDIATLVTAIRAQRKHSVQNSVQYLFVYLVVAEFISTRVPDMAIDLAPFKAYLNITS